MLAQKVDVLEASVANAPCVSTSRLTSVSQTLQHEKKQKPNYRVGQI